MVRLIGIDDLAAIRLLSDAQISPDGGEIAFVLTTLDLEADCYRAAIWLYERGSGQVRRFTYGSGRDLMPRWSPDGTLLAFVSDRAGTDQLWVMPRYGGEARQLTRFSEPVTAFEWAPDSRRLAVVTRATQAEGAPERLTDVVRLTALRYRFDGQRGFLHERRSHLWLVLVDDGRVERLTDGDWDDDWPSWSPDGSALVFTSNRTEDREWNAASELWCLRFDEAGVARVERLAGGREVALARPAWSPNGQLIAAVGHLESWAGSARHKRLWSIAPDGSGLRCLTREFDATLDDVLLGDTFGPSRPGLVWSPDSRSVYAQVSEQGAVRLYRFPVDGGEPQCLLGGARRVQDFSLSRDGQWIAATVADPLDPGSLWLLTADGRRAERIFDPNDEWKRTVTLTEPEELWVSSPTDAMPIHAWVMRPPAAAVPAGRPPLVLSIHGGPHAMYGWVYCHEFQVLAAAGYAVVYANPRGSQGYGEAFVSCTRGAWGEADMPDLMAVVDAVVAQGWVDPERLGVCGGSYGGYMTNWIIGHTDRFKAAVSMRCVSNLLSMYGTSDIGIYFSEWEIGAAPWEDPERYRRLSPLTYAPNMQTPLLLLHAEEDWRCPIGQAEELFAWLRRLGRTVELVRFPGEGHNLTRSGRPRHRIEHLERELRWFRTYL